MKQSINIHLLKEKARQLKIAIFKRIPVYLIKNTALRKWIHHKPIPQHISTFTVRGSQIRLHSDQSPIVTSAYWLGIDGYEQREVELWRILCRHSSIIVEIGGNIGYFTTFGAYANKNASYTVYEPLYYSFMLLEKHIKLNSLDNVCAVNAAVVSNNLITEIDFYLPEQERDYAASTGGYIHGAEAMDRKAHKKLSVAVVQSLKALKGADLVKLDVEGAEYEILEGSTIHIKENRPIILVELRAGTEHLRNWIKILLTQSNYQAWALDQNRSWNQLSAGEISRVNLQQQFYTRDLLLLPLERLNVIN
jgi:FkbM family methyltransferase